MPGESADKARARVNKQILADQNALAEMPTPLETQLLDLLGQQAQAILGSNCGSTTAPLQDLAIEVNVLESMIRDLFQMRQRALCDQLPHGYKFNEQQESVIDTRAHPGRDLDKRERQKLVTRMRKVLRVGPPTPKHRFAWEVWRAAIFSNAEAYDLLNENVFGHLAWRAVVKQALISIGDDKSRLVELATRRFIQRNAFANPELKSIDANRLASLFRGIHVDGVGRGPSFAAATLATECKLFGYERKHFDTAQEAFRKCLQLHPDGRPWTQVEAAEQARAIAPKP